MGKESFIDRIKNTYRVLLTRGMKGCYVYFVDDGGGVFDQIAFPNADSAFAALARNGFARLIEDTHLQSFLSPPAGPYQERSHPSGRIYSSGRYWRG